jgi:hypothetical protein
MKMFIKMPILVASKKGLEGQTFREANFVKLAGHPVRTGQEGRGFPAI